MIQYIYIYVYPDHFTGVLPPSAAPPPRPRGGRPARHAAPWRPAAWDVRRRGETSLPGLEMDGICED